MSKYQATVRWSRNNARFLDGHYSRKHIWEFDGGAEIIASASPLIVPIPYSDPQAVDPEEALIAAASSCHMLWFLNIAQQEGFAVDKYHDEASGIMTSVGIKKPWISKINLFPRTTWAGAKPKPHVLRLLHENAHDNCYIANSLKAEIEIHL